MSEERTHDELERDDEERDDDDLRARDAYDGQPRDEAERADETADAGAGMPTAAAVEPGTERDPEPGADEQLTVPEDREAAAAADRRAGGPTPDGNGMHHFDLFDGASAEDYRRRWDAVQASFIDDPRAATEQADTLVGELVDRVSRHREELRDEVGSRSDQGDTEAMRMALRQYRELFQTLVRE